MDHITNNNIHHTGSYNPADAHKKDEVKTNTLPPAGALSSEAVDLPPINGHSISNHQMQIKQRLDAFAEENLEDTKEMTKNLHEANRLFEKANSLEATPQNMPSISEIYIEIMKIFDEIRKIQRKTASTEQQMSLELNLKAADKIREAGKERMIAQVVNASFSMASSVASMAGSAIVSKMAQNKYDKAFKEQTAGKADINGDIPKDVAKAAQKFAGKEMKLFNKPASSVVEGTAGILKATGELVQGVKQIDIAAAEGAQKEYEAYAQNASQNRDTAARAADDFLQEIKKLLENAQRLNDTQNQAISSIARNMV